MPFLFLNTALLAGAAAAVIPIIVHLMHLQRPRSDFLPTLRFLKKGLKANRRRMRIRHILVLLLRIAAVLAIVATLSRPAWLGALSFRAGSAPVSAVVVLDNSASMAYTSGGSSRLERARQTACMAVRSLPPGSRAALVVTGVGPRGEGLDREFRFNANSLCAEIAHVEISAFGGTCTDALSRAWSMLEEDSGGAFAGSEVYVLTDLAANSWPSLSGLRPGEATATFVIDVGGGRNENFRVLKAESSWLGAPQPHVEVSAVFEGAELSATRLVELHLAGAKRAERVIEVPAGAAARETFDVSLLQEAGRPLQGWVALADADPLRADNSFYITVPARREIRCLILSDSPGARAGAAFFLSNALEPPNLKGQASANVTVRQAAEFSFADLAEVDCLILADVESLPGAAWRAITAFLENGGGVVVFLGEHCREQSYNAFLRNSFGAELAGMRRTGKDDGTSFSVLSFDHPALAAFAGGRNGNLAAARFYNRRILQKGAEGAAAVELARFTGGSPALLAATVGDGRAVAAAFAPLSSDTDLVLRASFVPFVNEIAAWASGSSRAAPQARRDFFVGETVKLAAPLASGPLRAEIVTPFDAKPVEIRAAGESASLLYRAWFPGNYLARIHDGGGSSLMGFSVNLPGAETDGARTTGALIEEAIPGCSVVEELGDRRIVEAKGATRGAREIFDFFLVAALALLALEAYIANRFYRESGGR